MPCFVLGQNLKVYQPEEIRKIETNFSKEFLEKFNSPESIKLCEFIYKKMEVNRIYYDDLNAEEKEILQFCDEGKTNPWQIPFSGCSWYCGGRIESIVASNVSDTLMTNRIHDKDYGTPWIGNSNNATKEKITYTFRPESAYVTDIVIVNGFAKTDSLFTEYSRVKRIKLFYNNREVAILNLLDIKDEQVFTLPPMGYTDRRNYEKLEKMKEWSITFKIEEIYMGNKNNVAISELYFDGDGGAHSED